MFRAYRYRLEYSGRRERMRKICDSNLSLTSVNNPVTSQFSKGASYIEVKLNQVECVAYP